MTVRDVGSFRGIAGLSDPAVERLERLREVVQRLAGTRGTAGSIITSGTVSGGSSGVGTGLAPDDSTPAPMPTGVTVGAGFDFIGIETDDPTFTYGGGYGRTKVYGATYSGSGPLPTFAHAVLVHEFVGGVGTFPVEAGVQWHIWLKWETNAGQESRTPSGGTNGHVVTSGQDPAGVIGSLQNTGTAWINDAMIADLAAGKINAGSLKVGSFIQSSNYISGTSGWRISADGIARLETAIIRGTIYANAGSIGGATIDSTGVESTNYDGLGNGWRLDNVGQILAGSIKISNVGGSRVFDTTATGSQPVLKVGSVIEILANGNSSFGGTLTAPNGTLGTITAGFLQNSSGSTYVNLNATGSQTLLSAASGLTRITADGDAFFLKTAATGAWSGNRRFFTVDPAGEFGPTVTKNGTDIAIDTGFDVDYEQLTARSLTVRGWISGTNFAPGGFRDDGDFLYAPDCELSVSIRHPRFASGAPIDWSTSPYPAYKSRVFIIARIGMFDVEIGDVVSLTEYPTQINVTQINWSLDWAV